MQSEKEETKSMVFQATFQIVPVFFHSLPQSLQCELVQESCAWPQLAQGYQIKPLPIYKTTIQGFFSMHSIPCNFLAPDTHGA